MPVQNALKLIQLLREEKTNLDNSMLLKDLLAIAEKRQLPCTATELEKAFEIDWKMRWVKLQNHIADSTV